MSGYDPGYNAARHHAPVTGGWAATNTLREYTTHDGICDICGSGVLNSEHIANYPCALAVVEAALDAARDLLDHIPLPLEPTQQDLDRIVALDVALAAARRAVREDT